MGAARGGARLRLLVGAAFTIGLLAWALRGVSWDAVLGAVGRAKPGWLALGLVTFLASFFVRARRWGTLLPRARAGSFRARLQAVFIGFAGNCILPANAGEIARAAALKRIAHVPFGTALGSIFAERLLDSIVVFFFLLAPLVVHGSTGPYALRLGAVPVAWIGIVLAALAVTLLVAALWPRRMAALSGNVAKLVGLRRFAGRIEAAAGALLTGLDVLRRPRRALGALAQSVVMWSLTAITFWTGMLAFGITEPGLNGALFTQSVGAFSMAIPSAPGYFGPYEAAVRLALGTYGVPVDAIVAYALTMHVLAYGTLMAIGLPLALRAGISWRTMRGPAAAAARDDGGALGEPPPRVRVLGHPAGPLRVEIRDLIGATRDDRLAAAYLHAAILPGSPIVRLGTDFMADFYYRHLVDDALIGCRVAWVDGRPAGFVVYTPLPHDFMPAGLRRHFGALAGVVTRALLARPARVATIARALGVIKLRRNDFAAGPIYDAEILSLGVLPQYRTSEFVRRTGVRLGQELLREATAELQAAGRSTIATLIEVRDRATALFLHSMGFRFQREWISGVDCLTAVYEAAESQDDADAGDGRQPGCVTRVRRQRSVLADR